MQDARRINVNPSGLLLSLHPGPGLYTISNPRKSPGNETSSDRSDKDYHEPCTQAIR